MPARYVFMDEVDAYPASADEEGDPCLLYTSDAADERSSVDLGGRRIIKKKTQILQKRHIRILQTNTNDGSSTKQ